MAERRMFSQRIIGSARFLRMPATARLLYYDLGMYADDDGIVEAFTVMQMTHAVEDDLRVLISKGFVQMLNEDLVTFISDWTRNNMIRKDRYTPSMYQALLPKVQAADDGRGGGIMGSGSVVNRGEERGGQERAEQISAGETGRSAEACGSEAVASGDVVSVKACFEDSFGRKPDRSFLGSMRRQMHDGMGAEEICALIRQSVRSSPRKPEAYILAMVEKQRKGRAAQQAAVEIGEEAPLAEWEINWLTQVKRRKEAFEKSLQNGDGG